MPIRFFSCAAFIFSVVCCLFATFFLIANESPIAFTFISLVNFLLCLAISFECFLHIFVLKFSVTRSIIIEALLIAICSIAINQLYGWVTFAAMLAIIFLSFGQQILDTNYLKEEEELKELRKLNFK
ncbi:hypothetical protein [Fluviispira sanaruensis]|uniref:Uncharacterized protein n=1 Tax=Fluviispira sanaruensis TaxID=2493639 RepID=A0A4P2VUU3_FLUSA|nr:hypothetical protein [Fluviispira sanaruensis]BBH52652.1 hypothetical protein JCM31447_10930 [Fluviispira sanaruensis]